MKRFELLLTEEQLVNLEEKSRKAGFLRKSEYIRLILFIENSFTKKIDEIYKRLIENA